MSAACNSVLEQWNGRVCMCCARAQSATVLIDACVAASASCRCAALRHQRSEGVVPAITSSATCTQGNISPKQVCAGCNAAHSAQQLGHHRTVVQQLAGLLC